MRELILIVGPLAPDLGPCPVNPESFKDGATQTVVQWEGWEAPEGHVPLVAYLRKDLELIRAEHAAWVYDLGRLVVGGKETQEYLKGGHGLSMWWCSLLYERHPKMTPGLYTVFKLRALERLMDEGGYTALRLCGGDATLREVLADMCTSSGRTFIEQHENGVNLKPAMSLTRRLYNATPAPLRALARYAYWLWTVRRKLPAVVRAGEALPPVQGPAGAGGPVPTATIATYFPNVDMKAAEEGRFRSRYWESLHDALDASFKNEGAPWVRWLFIRFPAPQLSFEQCIALRDRFRQANKDGASFHYLEEFLRHRDLWAALWRFLRVCVSSRKLERAVRPAFRFAGSHVNFWPYMGEYWAESFRGWRGLERCLQQRGCDVYAQAAGQQRWTLFPLENCPWERMLSYATHAAARASGVSTQGAGQGAGQAGQAAELASAQASAQGDLAQHKQVAPHGAVIGAQHSTVRPTDFRYFDDPRAFEGFCAAFQPDLVRGNGDSACQQWLQAGFPPEKLGKVEALRYMYLAEGKKLHEGGPTAGAEGASGAGATGAAGVAGATGATGAAGAAGVAGKPKRLLAVTSFFRDETEAHLVLLARALHAGLLDGWQIVVKPHPYLSVEDRLRALLGRRFDEVRVARGAIAEELVPGVVVWSSNSTTVALEAALKGLPVMSMLPVDDFDLCPLQDVAALARTGNVEDVALALAGVAPLHLPPNYLDLDPALPRWKKLIGV